MKIRIPREATVGDITIQPGEYDVALSAEQSQVNLIAGGRDIKLQATRRPIKKNTKSKSPSVSFYSLGGTSWSLVYVQPPKFEWVVFLKVQQAGAGTGGGTSETYEIPPQK